jgi:serine protease Do
MSMKKMFVTGFAAVALVAAGCAFGRWSVTDRAPEAPQVARAAAPPVTAAPGGALPSFGDLAARVSPTVVHVKVVSVKKVGAIMPGFTFPKGWFGQPSPAPFSQLPEREFKQQGTGSGFIIGADGLVLTNNHVVDDAKDITVTLADKRELPAEVVGRDPKTDLAVLGIHADGLPVAPLGDSDALRVGDWVLAVGNPFGLNNSVTAGIVSAKGRVIGAGPYDDFIQTDAPINPGNSGGPLFDEHGQVVGINTAIFSQSGGSVGIGFALPINQAKQLLPQLETTGHVTRAWLGVAIQGITPDLAQSLGLKDPRGALVADVTADGPAAKAGVERGDVIVGYDGTPIADANTLPMAVASTKIGRTVPLDVVRNGERKTLEVTVHQLADDEVALDHSAGAADKAHWGLALRDLSPEERTRLDLAKDEGVLVAGVRPESPADDAGVQSGDVVLEVDRTAVGSVAELKKAVERAGETEPLLLLLHRADGHNQFLALAAK